MPREARSQEGVQGQLGEPSDPFPAEPSGETIEI